MSQGFDLTTCPLLTRSDIGVLCRGIEIVKRGIYHGWLVAKVHTSATNRGKSLYTRADVDRFIARLEAGEVPAPLPRGKEAE